MTDAKAYRVRGAPIIHDTIDDETIAINQLSGAYYSLEGPSALVWQMLAAGATSAHITGELERRYTAQPAEIEGAVDELLSQLLAEELIVDATAELQPSSASGAELPPAPAQRTAFPGLRLQGYTDLATLLLADPIHEVDETGWPTPMARRG